MERHIVHIIPPVLSIRNMNSESDEHRDQLSSEAAKREDAATALLSLSPSVRVWPPTYCMNTIQSLPRKWSVMESGCKAMPQQSSYQMLEQHERSPTTVVQRQMILPFINLPPVPSTAVSSCDSSVDSSLSPKYTENNGTRFYHGSTTLAISEDEESLSPLHCFMRKYCVEAFTATAGDVSTPRYGKSHGRNIVVGQVGIQCSHCKHRSYGRRQERSVCFPSSIKNIYHSMETWQRRHSAVCQDIPSWAKRTMVELMGQSRSGAGGRRQYWETSAIRLGMEDTAMGIRFNRTPGDKFPHEAISYAKATVEQPSSQAVVFEDDRKLVTDYLFTLLAQMETCYFAEQDRVGGRSKVKDCPIGYVGVQCKHCAGKAGFGRYFPVSIEALTSANSDRNIFNHIIKCRRCPIQVKQELHRYLEEQQDAKNRRGLRKVFFQRVWQRMHGVPIQKY